jgi:hypothetical protein
MALLKILYRPFPRIGGAKNKFWAALAFGIFVFLFLFFFKPFGIGTFTTRQILLYALGFGGVTFAVMFINLLILDKIFSSFFKEETWTVGKEIFITLVHIVFIGLGNYLFANWLSITETSFNRLLYFEFISLSLSIFPVTVWTLIKENMLLRRNRKEAEEFEPVLHPEKTPAIAAEGTVKQEIIPPGYDINLPITFTSENESATLKADPRQVLFISSADNYIKIYLLEGDAVIPKLLRSSLKRTGDDLKNHHQFYRCHRAYIVNLQKIESVSGNARGLKLILENCPVEVLVSRSLNDVIKMKLQQIHSL